MAAGVFVGRRRLHGSYTTASTAATLGFQPVVPETVARSLKAVGFLGVAPGSWDFRRMERCAISQLLAPVIAQRKSSLTDYRAANARAQAGRKCASPPSFVYPWHGMNGLPCCAITLMAVVNAVRDMVRHDKLSSASPAPQGIRIQHILAIPSLPLTAPANPNGRRTRPPWVRASTSTRYFPQARDRAQKLSRNVHPRCSHR